MLILVAVKIKQALCTASGRAHEPQAACVALSDTGYLSCGERLGVSIQFDDLLIELVEYAAGWALLLYFTSSTSFY